MLQEGQVFNATQDGHISAERELRQTVPDAAAPDL
jgi:hypothetical protein